MNNIKPKNGGSGDRIISNLRLVGDVLESTTIRLFATGTMLAAVTATVRIITDLKITRNNNKLKGNGGKNELK